MKMPMTYLIRSTSILIFLAFAAQTAAFTTREFLGLCESEVETCAARPAVQFYLGGALDALAVVNESVVGEKRPLYCIEEKQLFDMHKIVIHIAGLRKQFRDKNVMYTVIDYLRVYGECKG